MPPVALNSLTLSSTSENFLSLRRNAQIALSPPSSSSFPCLSPPLALSLLSPFLLLSSLSLNLNYRRRRANIPYLRFLTFNGGKASACVVCRRKTSHGRKPRVRRSGNMQNTRHLLFASSENTQSRPRFPHHMLFLPATNTATIRLIGNAKDLLCCDLHLYVSLT